MSSVIDDPPSDCSRIWQVLNRLSMGMVYLFKVNTEGLTTVWWRRNQNVILHMERNRCFVRSIGRPDELEKKNSRKRTSKVMARGSGVVICCTFSDEICGWFRPRFRGGVGQLCGWSRCWAESFYGSVPAMVPASLRGHSSALRGLGVPATTDDDAPTFC